jgi:hypothetical protein
MTPEANRDDHPDVKRERARTSPSLFTRTRLDEASKKPIELLKVAARN